MRKTLLVLAACMLGSSSPAVAQQAEVMAAVTQFVDGFNKGDAKALVGACAAETSIIDEFPPHEWHGIGACQKWMNDYDANAKANGITDGLVTLGKPSHVDVTGDRAYVVIPSTYTWKEKGVDMREDGSAFTFAMHREKAGWRFVGWSWAKK
ncbi:MAG: nuclear transport factor 2 family protein [Gemmatimonadaceae bacterium]|nr:nuclear transport factor 2 family protein [Gemmatimonadaceae bacterium]